MSRLRPPRFPADFFPGARAERVPLFRIGALRIERRLQLNPDTKAVHAALPCKILPEPAKAMAGQAPPKLYTKKLCARSAASRAGGTQRLVSLSHCARAAADRRCATVLTTSQFTIGRDSEAGGGETGSGAYIES